MLSGGSGERYSGKLCALTQYTDLPEPVVLEDFSVPLILREDRQVLWQQLRGLLVEMSGVEVVKTLNILTFS